MITITNTENLDVLVREAIQNAFDQRLNRSDDGLNVPEIEFRLTAIDAETEEFIFDTILADAPAELFPGILRTKTIETKRVLYISDRNTAGLSGTTNPLDHENKERSNFYRFFWPTKRPANARTGEGGTYGVGRHILHAMSEAETLLVYSRYLGVDDEICEIFLGVTLADPTTELMGVHFWGPGITDTEHPVPIFGHPAREAAQRAGFPLAWYDIASTGTSIAVLQPLSGVLDLDSPAPSIDDRQLSEIDSIRESLNLWAWPHLVDKSLGMYTANGDAVTNRIVNNEIPELGDWVTSYGIEENANNHLEIRLGQVAVGDLKFLRKIIGVDTENHKVPLSGIALMRGVKFIVKYLPVQMSVDGFGVRGVFVAKEGEPDEVFRNSEPATHDDWKSGAQIGIPQIPKLVEKTLAAIQKKLKSILSIDVPQGAISSRGLGQLSRKWASAYFDNSNELQPDLAFEISATVSDDEQPDLNPGHAGNGEGNGNTVRRGAANTRVIEKPTETEFSTLGEDRYVSKLCWELHNNSRSPKVGSLSVVAVFLTGDGTESRRLEKSDGLADELFEKPTLMEIVWRSTGSQAKMPKNMKPTDSLLLKEFVLPASSITTLTVKVSAPIGNAVDVAVKFQ